MASQEKCTFSQELIETQAKVPLKICISYFNINTPLPTKEKYIYMLIFQQKVWIGHMNLGGAATQDEGTCSGALPIHMVDGTMWLLISWLPRNGYRPWKASILILYQHLFGYPIIHTSISFI